MEGGVPERLLVKAFPDVVDSEKSVYKMDGFKIIMM